MTRSFNSSQTDMTLSHFELYVQNIIRMEDFYIRCLGFTTTDRGEGPDGLVFLSRSPDEHHQLVLNPQPARSVAAGTLDHISFRVGSLQGVRAIHSALMKSPATAVEAVSHGTTWSIYFRDPEGNRLEVFTNTPWYVPQPCRFSIDLGLDDDQLYEFTEEKVRDLPGFKPAEEWRKSHKAAVTGDTRKDTGD